MKQKGVKIAYWIITALFAAFMLFSGISGMIGSEAGNEVITSLGYPLYINYILGVAKILGAIVLLVPKCKTLKEWAYAGFTFDQLGASASFAFTGMGFVAIIVPLISLAVMFVSYWLWKKSSRN